MSKSKTPGSVAEAAVPLEPVTYVNTAEPSPARRLREKLLARGARVLTDGELVTIVIGDERVSRRIVRRYGPPGLAEVPVVTWRRAEGLGVGATARLSAVCELARRAYGCAGAARPTLCRPQDVHRHVRRLTPLKKEHLVGLYLDAQNGLIHEETVSVGSLNTTRTHPREILEPAIRHLALGFILVHNHPSGCVEPSPEDVEFTRAVARAGEIMGIELYDHLVVAAGGFTSLRERGVL